MKIIENKGIIIKFFLHMYYIFYEKTIKIWGSGDIKKNLI